MTLYIVVAEMSEESYSTVVNLLGVFDSEEKARSYISKIEETGLAADVIPMELNSGADVIYKPDGISEGGVNLAWYIE